MLLTLAYLTPFIRETLQSSIAGAYSQGGIRVPSKRVEEILQPIIHKVFEAKLTTLWKKGTDQ
jgi:hypothetical protein